MFERRITLSGRGTSVDEKIGEKQIIDQRSFAEAAFTDDHDGEFKAALGNLAVDLVR